MKPYRIYILQYARREAQANYYLLGDIHNTASMDIGYYMWLVTNGEHTVMVDMGFTEAKSRERGRDWIAHPGELMEQVGVDPASIQHVVVSHMHWDHAGNYALFPNATFYLQDDEMAFWTGRHAGSAHFGSAMEVEDVVALVRLNYDGRVRFIDGHEEILPGITVHKAPGHTKGVQVTQVACESGPAVVASDAVHTYENLRRNLPTPIIYDAALYLESYGLIRSLAADERHILPGHDAEQFKGNERIGENIAVLS